MSSAWKHIFVYVNWCLAGISCFKFNISWMSLILTDSVIWINSTTSHRKLHVINEQPTVRNLKKIKSMSFVSNKLVIKIASSQQPSHSFHFTPKKTLLSTSTMSIMNDCIFFYFSNYVIKRVIRTSTWNTI